MPLDLPRRSVLETLLAESARQPLLALVGARGSGKSTLLQQLGERSGRRSALARIEALATTPAGLASELRRLTAPLLEIDDLEQPFQALLRALARRPEDSLLLLDDVTELRTLSHFPDVEAPLQQVLRALARGPGRTVVTSRFSFWLRREHPELALVPVPPVSPEEIGALGVSEAAALAEATGGLVHHVVRLAETMDARGAGLEAALALELSTGGRVEAECRATLAELLLRARGYAACKAVLRILADEEGLKLTEIARRMDRTAGSTRDYLRWLEEVDLLRASEKRFYYVDPLVRLWSRIHGQGVLATAEDVRREVGAYLDGLGARRGSAELEVDATGSFTLPAPASESLVEID